MIAATVHLTFCRALMRAVACAWLGIAVASATELRPFSAKSLEELRQAHAGRPFILAFWSITCEPCRQELRLLEGLHRKFPTLSIVLVAADAPDQQPAVIRFLADYKLGRIETRQFSEYAAKVRYSVDRTWRGELPRTYFFNAAHEVTVHSGVLDAEEAEAWMKRQGTPEPGPGTRPRSAASRRAQRCTQTQRLCARRSFSRAR
jgi:thiol-disulfide isomerase/thioredoxin